MALQYIAANHYSRYPVQMTALTGFSTFFNPRYIEYPVVGPFNHRYVAKGMNAMLRVPIIAVLLGMPALAHAVEYRCKVEKKFDFENVYSQAQIEKGQFSVLVEEKGVSAFLSRCSFTPSAQKVTCDRYEVDKTVFDENVKIKKYYVLRSHFDVQVFSDLSFVENNGRGGVAFGKFSVVAP